MPLMCQDCFTIVHVADFMTNARPVTTCPSCGETGLEDREAMPDVLQEAIAATMRAGYSIVLTPRRDSVNVEVKSANLANTATYPLSGIRTDEEGLGFVIHALTDQLLGRR